MQIKMFAIILSIALLASGCKAASKTPEGNPAAPSSKINNEPALQYEVDSDGGAFTSSDLIYFIMIDRFMDGDSDNNTFKDTSKNNPRAYHGGDFKGIIDKLDYIKSLGATAIWLTPVAENTEKGYHGYWINDFYKVDPHFGSMDDLKALVSEAHKRDIKVLLDHVVNHASPASLLLQEKSSDWFHPKQDIKNWNSQEELENNWLYGLPDFNTENPEVKDYLIDNTLWWIEQTGVDGMRLDTVRHVPKSFWNEFAYRVKEKYPDFYLLGEVWNDSSPKYLEQYHRAGIDGMTDYPLFKGIREAFTRYGKSDSLISAIKQRNQYSNPEVNGIFLDNHDNKRLVTYAGENGVEHLKQALAFIMTYPSIPVIYYGTEIAMEGGDDPDNRRDMEWAKTENSEMLDYYKRLVALRKSNAALMDGTIEVIESDSYSLSYIRRNNDQSVVAVMNLQNKEKTVSISIPAQAAAFQDALTGKSYQLKDGSLQLTLKPLEVLLLESK